MSIKQKILQKGQYKLSPQQIKLMKLIQLSTLDFEKNIQQEIEDNPAFDIDETLDCNYNTEKNINDETIYDNKCVDENKNDNNIDEKIDIYEYLSEDEKEEYNINNIYSNNIENNIYFTSKISLQEHLKNQLHIFNLKKEDLIILNFILGNIDDDGYLRRNTKSISDDIFLVIGKFISEKKIDNLIKEYIHRLDPIGIGSRNLKECLLIQLNKKNKNDNILLAIKIIEDYFDFFIKKHYDKLQKKLNINKNRLKQIISNIKQLNPKPGTIYSESIKTTHQIIPDFTISILDNEKLELTLHKKNTPSLRISSTYIQMSKSNKIKHKKKIISFINNKINSAKWVIDAINKRKNTLMLTMSAIIQYQKDYFLTGDLTKIKPMILKTISKKIGVDISTVSRVANSKYIDTPYGTFLIKKFFSEKIKNNKGKDISSIEIKKLLIEYISKENKENPLTDEQLSIFFKKKGYIIARRTIAKYRNNMNIPVSRMRKSL